MGLRSIRQTRNQHQTIRMQQVPIGGPSPLHLLSQTYISCHKSLSPTRSLTAARPREQATAPEQEASFVLKRQRPPSTNIRAPSTTVTFNQLGLEQSLVRFVDRSGQLHVSRHSPPVTNLQLPQLPKKSPHAAVRLPRRMGSPGMHVEHWSPGSAELKVRSPLLFSTVSQQSGEFKRPQGAKRLVVHQPSIDG